MKNFSNAKVVLVTIILRAKAQTEMIYYTFLLPGKNESWQKGRGFQFIPSFYKLKSPF
jgi:hypothetical protein